MSAHSGRPDESDPWGITRKQIPVFAAFALCSADEDTELPDAEAAILSPGAVPDRRRTFRLGRLAAHEALAAIGRDDGPVLAGKHREPIWPEGVVGSISHTVDMGVALVAPAANTDGVGVDIEQRRFAPELQRQVPRAEELAWLDAVDPDDREDELLALFSAKESIFKAFYPSVGSFFGFTAASLTPQSSGYLASLVEPIDSRYPPGRTFEIGCEWSGERVLTFVVLPKSG